MAIIKSAKKNIRKSARNKVFNIRRQRAASIVVKEIKTLVSEGKAKDAKALLPKAQKALDKAAKKGTIEKNTASRTKSRLSNLIKKAS
jgi:small subunit ribosomal protein S20